MLNKIAKQISGITKETKEVKENYAYFCFVGEKSDGHDYVKLAIENGATVIVGTKPIELKEDNVTYYQVEDSMEAMAQVAEKFYNSPQKELKIIGVTGTDGKTTISFLLSKILNKISKAAYIGTNGFYIADELKSYTGITSPFPNQLFEYLSQARENNCEYVVMEVSSHALKQKRDYLIEYEQAIFTNLTEEHLDFHPNMEDYYLTKSKLFAKAKVAIINVDDRYGKRLSQETKVKQYAFGENHQTCGFNVLQETIQGNEFEVYLENKKWLIKSDLLAKINIYNLSSVIFSLIDLGYEPKDYSKDIKSLSVPGRLETIRKEGCPDIIIDFAHTPDSIKKVMSFLYDIAKKKNKSIWTITGSAGGRDAIKRKAMGEYAAQYSDHLIFTMDDPRFEKVRDISEEMASGIKKEDVVVEFIDDRQKAIEHALINASNNDIIVLLGKGAQKYMYIEDKEVPYYEYDVVNKLLEKMEINNV